MQTYDWRIKTIANSTYWTHPLCRWFADVLIDTDNLLWCFSESFLWHFFMCAIAIETISICQRRKKIENYLRLSKMSFIRLSMSCLVATSWEHNVSISSSAAEKHTHIHTRNFIRFVFSLFLFLFVRISDDTLQTIQWICRHFIVGDGTGNLSAFSITSEHDNIAVDVIVCGSMSLSPAHNAILCLGTKCAGNGIEDKKQNCMHNANIRWILGRIARYLVPTNKIHCRIVYLPYSSFGVFDFTERQHNAGPTTKVLQIGENEKDRERAGRGTERARESEREKKM